MRKQSSNARLMGAAGGSRANLLNRELLEHEITQHDIPEEDFINPDEFEEIAEIYDSLRLLHSRQSPDADAQLAKDFDLKLREVMEALSMAVNSETLPRESKLERSITAKVDLLTMCAEKFSDYLLLDPALNGVFLGIFDGLRDAYADLQGSHLDIVSQVDSLRQNLTRNQIETQQLLEAAENLERQNVDNRERAEMLTSQINH